MKVGIFGGSFNPVHRGHLRLATEALSELNLDKVYFVPSRQNPLKKKEELLSNAVRTKLLKAAIQCGWKLCQAIANSNSLKK